jgi:hypothetical protein
MVDAPKEEAKRIENAEIIANNPSTVGLKMLQDAAAEHVKSDGRDNANSYIHDVREKLIADGFMSGITYEYAAKQMEPGEKMSANFYIYSSKENTLLRHVQQNTDLGLALQEDFAGRFPGIADGTASNDIFYPTLSVSHEGLEKAVKRSDDAVSSLKVGEDLKESGPQGPLWKILQKEDSHGNITLGAVERSLNEADDRFSENQLVALRDLKSTWNENNGAKRYATVWSDEFQPFNPLNAVNPLYSLNPLNGLNPLNHQSHLVQVDYLTPQAVSDLLARLDK